MSRRLRVRHQEPRLCERIWRPDIRERSAASICNPEAGILPIPALLKIGICRVVVVVRIAAAAVSPQNPYIIDERLLSRLPQHCNGPGIDSTGEYAYPAQDVLPSRRRKQYCLRRSNTQKPRCL